MQKNIDRLREKAATLPATPGVYLMKDKDGGILYVGKSKKLKNRVSSYFIGSTHSVKTARMVSLVFDFDYILCDSEVEALTLENVLIKRHTPRYNIKLKDAKSYPYIKITKEEYPRLLVTRTRTSDGGTYFGPYGSASDARSAAETVSKILGIPTCRRVFPRDIGRERPCIYRQMGRCVAPCTGELDAAAYRAVFADAAEILSGNIRGIAGKMEERMLAFAEREQYEEAARTRDAIAALSALRDRQKVVSDQKDEQDVFAVASEGAVSALAVLNIRGGALIHKVAYILSPDTILEPDGLSALICAYYGEENAIPRVLLLDFALPEGEELSLGEYLTKRAGHRVIVKTPQRGRLRALCNMAEENASEKVRRYMTDTAREDKTLTALAMLLGLEVLPERIEAYDISNIGNEHITASMVVYGDGGSRRQEYRKFTIQGTDGADDYGSMREALSRRLSHIGDGSPSLGTAPDLILLDGGRGQVNAVRAVMEKMGLDIPLFGMVKDDFHKTRALTDGDGEIGIATEQAVYTFVYKIQEEAHRFAYRASQGAKRKTLKHSSLEGIAGIGPKKAQRLLRSFGSLRALKAASREELIRIEGISERDAVSILAYFEKKRRKRNDTDHYGKREGKTPSDA